MINVIARAWTPTIRNILRPAGLLHAVISCVRFAAKATAGMLYLGSDIEPVAYGVQADCVQTNLSSIYRSNDNPKYPWSIATLPEGIIRFGQALSGECALLGEDFIYENGEYRFRTTPVVYATVSGASKGVPTATFNVTFGNRASIMYEDTFNRYDGAVDSVAIHAAREHDQLLSCCNGLSSYAILAACGIRPLTATGKIKATWSEGDKFLAATEQGKLLVDIADNPKVYIGASVEPKDSIASAVNTNIVVAELTDSTEGKHIYYWLPEDETIPATLLPTGYRNSSTVTAGRLQALSNYPIRVYDTTKGPSDAGSNKTLADRITLPIGVKLVQRLDVNLTNKAALSKATRVILHIGLTPQEPETRLATKECTPYYATYMYNCLDIEHVCNMGTKLYAITLNSKLQTPLFVPGSYILGVGLASGYDEDILEYESIDPVVIKAGACVALDIH